MHPNFPQSSLLMIISLLLLLLLSHHFRCAVCLNDDFHYLLCHSSSEFECGLEFGKIEFPFWAGHQPEYCGDPSFKLHCNEGEPPVIHIDNQTYEVIKIDNGDRILEIVNLDLSLGKAVPCPQYTFLDPTRFVYTAEVKLAAFSLGQNCNSDHYPGFYDFPCTWNKVPHRAYFAKNTSEDSELGSSCQNPAFVIKEYPVLKPELERLQNGLTDDVVGVLRKGFGLESRLRGL